MLTFKFEFDVLKSREEIKYKNNNSYKSERNHFYRGKFTV